MECTERMRGQERIMRIGLLTEQMGYLLYNPVSAGAVPTVCADQQEQKPLIAGRAGKRMVVCGCRDAAGYLLSVNLEPL